MLDWFLAITHPASMVLTLLLALLTGRHFANKWQPLWKLLPFVILFIFLERFLSYALFERIFIHFHMSIITASCVTFCVTLSYYLTRIKVFTKQYPWLYKENSVLFLKKKDSV